LAVAARWTEGPGAEGIREDCFAFPLVVRSRRPGDTIALPRGRKPLDELLSEWRVPERARAQLPLVEDRDGIVAVLGAAYGGKDRYRHRDGLGPAGRFLAITVKGALA
ncbi:MAG: tRNA lysidine(34) synthetase TilS, partial [Spirochaetaceae bacterium]|nr:tRNA lysidine(34) synthetase TilS [Spirochaetaceae bacterium]